jgi:hypothetical protein
MAESTSAVLVPVDVQPKAPFSKAQDVPKRMGNGRLKLRCAKL